MKNYKFKFSSLQRRRLLVFLFTILFSTYTWAQETKKPLKDAPAFTQFTYRGDDRIYKENPLQPDEFYTPILQGCYPDPSITRKGNDYYLVNSSFAMFPGVPIFQSNDLVNWKKLCHVLDRNSQLKV